VKNVKKGRMRAPFFALVAAFALTACGVKGPPLPPLVRIPAAPGELVAERRGNRVEVRFVVPAENTDGSRPANIERVDVYAITALPGVPDEVVLRSGARIGSVDVKAPRDPDQTVDPGEPMSDVEAPEGPGVDQGVTASVHEDLTAAAFRPADLEAESPVEVSGPLLLSEAALSRTFVGVGIDTRGRRGPVSRPAAVTLFPAPPPLPSPTVTYDETSIRVTWPAPATALVQGSSSDDVLPSRPLVMGMPTRAYNVYELRRPSQGDASDGPTEARLTESPVTEGLFVDNRIEWGVERCYTVRVVQTLGDSSVESDAAPSTCTTPKDTFAPLPPAGLNHVPSAGSITLIWNPNAEPDLTGYIVLRGPAGTGTLTRITPTPIQLTTFRDSVPAGARFTYAVQAIDKSGNLSPESARVEEAAR
jgi:hypothetical protein